MYPPMHPSIHICGYMVTYPHIYLSLSNYSSMHLPTNPKIYPLIILPKRLSIHQMIHPTNNLHYLLIYPSILKSIHLLTHPPIHPSNCPLINQAMHPPFNQLTDPHTHLMHPSSIKYCS